MSLHVVMAGASGFLGSNLRFELVRRGHRVTSLVRRPVKAPGESSWDPYAGDYDADVIEGADVVVNLAGSPTLGNPHSKKWSSELLESRVTTTRVLAEAIARSTHRPVYLAGNAVGWYGDHGAEPLTEGADSRGHTLMTTVCRQWHDAARPAVDAGARVCWLRTSPVMDRRNAPLKQLVPLFKAGLGAKLGSGRQRMPMISLRDWVDGVAFLVEHDSVKGPVNLAAPHLPTNAEFTKALAEAVHRKAFLVAPAPVLKVAAGRVSPELLGSVNAVPSALQSAGFVFRDPDVDFMLRTGLS
jgi:uncharacterized protein (TIGR01777 family)